MSMDRVLFWTRYIDDIFMIWQGTFQQLEEFLKQLNDNQINVRLTYKCHPHQIEFLDVLVKKDSHGFLQTDGFRKSTAANTLLHATSAHPKSMIDSILIGQYLRMRRICSSDVDFKKQADDLQIRFERSEREIFTRHWSILCSDSILDKYLPISPAITARRAKNLSDHLVCSHYQGADPSIFIGSGKKPWGCAPCGKCVACPNVEMVQFADSSGQKVYKITQSISCSTRAVVYYATCPCQKIYVGLTSCELKVLIREHVRDISMAKNAIDFTCLKPFPRHFRQKRNCDPSGLKVKEIDRINMNIRGWNIKKLLAQCEAKWIWTLKTQQPLGLNRNLSFAPFLRESRIPVDFGHRLPSQILENLYLQAMD